MAAPTENESSFDEILRKHFQILYVSDMSTRGAKQVGGTDPRDAAIVARFVGSDCRIEIGWSSFELSLAILLKYDKPELSRLESYVYFEPFVEFLTSGQERSIVPYITEKMAVRNIESVMTRRRSLFASGLDTVAEQLGKKLQIFLARVRAASIEEIKAYHKWISSTD